MLKREATGPQGKRDATANVLADAVLRVLARNGVLKGFSMKQVADEAGVDRGLVYHYFGDRQGLVRTALRRGIEERYASFDTEQVPHSPGRRWANYLKVMVSQADKVRLIALLHLDRDPKLRLLPIHHRTLPALQVDQDAGLLDQEVDLHGFLMLISSIGYGYTLFREGFARELDMTPDEADAALEQTLALMLDRLGPQSAASPAEGDSSTSSAT